MCEESIALSVVMVLVSLTLIFSDIVFLIQTSSNHDYLYV